MKKRKELLNAMTFTITSAQNLVLMLEAEENESFDKLTLDEQLKVNGLRLANNVSYLANVAFSLREAIEELKKVDLNG